MDSIKTTIYKHIKMGTRPSGSRKSDRTDMLNSGVISEIKNMIESFDINYKIKYEDTIECGISGKKFKIDIGIYKDGALHTVILNKAFISSVQKNKYNNANTSIGEIFRVLGKHADSNILFVTFIANVLPNYTKDGILNGTSSYETSYIDLAKIPSTPLWQEVCKRSYFATITYDIADVDYSSKDALHQTIALSSVKNINSTSFKNHIKKIFE